MLSISLHYVNRKMSFGMTPGTSNNLLNGIWLPFRNNGSFERESINQNKILMEIWQNVLSNIFSQRDFALLICGDRHACTACFANKIFHKKIDILQYSYLDQFLENLSYVNLPPMTKQINFHIMITNIERYRFKARALGSVGEKGSF